MTMERWISAIGWDGYYEVSDYGRVRSWRQGRIVRRQPRIKTIRTTKAGYQFVLLGGRDRFEGWTVHRLVLSSFTGTTMPKDVDCRHLDGDKQNNALSNLAWGTRKENEADKRSMGKTAMGSRNGQSKLTEAEAALTLAARARGEKQSEIAKALGVSPGTISAVCLRKTWKHVKPSDSEAQG